VGFLAPEHCTNSEDNWSISIISEIVRFLKEPKRPSLDQLRRSRKDGFGIVRIGVFGSAARDDVDEESDVDIVVEIAEPDLLTLVGIKEELEEPLQRPVDVVRCRENMNRFLKQRIERDAVCV
jgi:predicted nucleotidyltransferase